MLNSSEIRKKSIMIVLFMIYFVVFAKAQYSNYCTGGRFIDDIFSAYNPSLNVRFGNNTTIGGNNKDLNMHVFEPSSDVATSRPLIILAHGGGFTGGSKLDMVPLCLLYTGRGYVTATIDYRLIDVSINDSLQLVDGIIKAIADLRAAVRFFKEDAATLNTFAIDTNLIFVGGISAGAVMANHVNFMDTLDLLPGYINSAVNANGGFEGNSSANLDYSSSVNGVINLSGSISRIEWIDSDDPPIYSAHDYNDQVVPYGYDSSSIFSFPAYSYGSGAIHEKAELEGIYSRLFTEYSGNGHVSYLLGSKLDTVFSQSVDFLYHIVCDSSASTSLPIVNSNQSINTVVSYSIQSNKLNLQFGDYGNYNLFLYDALGKVSLTTEVRGQKEFSLATEDLKGGLYILRIEDSSDASKSNSLKIIF